MNFKKTPHFGRPRKFTAGLTAALFVFMEICFFPSQALAQNASRKVPSAAAPPLLAEKVPFAIPPELGKVDEVYYAPRESTSDQRPELRDRRLLLPTRKGKETAISGRRSRFVVFIQDAHDSLEAQENIAKLIERLVAEQGIRTVFEEGYEGPVPTDQFFGFIKDPAVKQKVSYFLLDKLRIGGAEYAHINRAIGDSKSARENLNPKPYALPSDFDLIGVEDLKLYGENLRAYRTSAQNRPSIEEDLKELSARITCLADRYFPKKLKNWLKEKDLLGEGKLLLLDYLLRTRDVYLEKQSVPVFTQKYPALAILHLAQSSRDSKLIDQLNALDYKVVFDEIMRLEREISESYLQTERDRRIFGYYQGLVLLRRLNRIELTQPEYEAAQETLLHFETRKLADFIASQTHRSLVLSKAWEWHIKDAVRFYNIAQQRDGALAKALEKHFEGDSVERIPQGLRTERAVGYRKSQGQENLSAKHQPLNPNAAILVYGGFHSSAIKGILKNQGISYVVISPKISSIDKRHQDYYKRLMSEGSHSFEMPFLFARANRSPGYLYLAATGRAEFVRSELLHIASSVKAGNIDPLLIERALTVGTSQSRSEAREVKPEADEGLLAKQAALLGLPSLEPVKREIDLHKRAVDIIDDRIKPVWGDTVDIAVLIEIARELEARYLTNISPDLKGDILAATSSKFNRILGKLYFYSAEASKQFQNIERFKPLLVMEEGSSDFKQARQEMKKWKAAVQQEASLKEETIRLLEWISSQLMFPLASHVNVRNDLGVKIQGMFMNTNNCFSGPYYNLCYLLKGDLFKRFAHRPDDRWQCPLWLLTALRADDQEGVNYNIQMMIEKRLGTELDAAVQRLDQSAEYSAWAGMIRNSEAWKARSLEATEKDPARSELRVPFQLDAMVRASTETGEGLRADVETIPEGILKQFIIFLNRHQIDDVIPLGGVVRDTLLGVVPGDIAFGVRVVLPRALREQFDQDVRILTPMALDQKYKLSYRADMVLNKVARQMGISLSRLFRLRENFQGISLENSFSAFVIGDQLVDVSGNSGLSIEKIGMDRNGRIYQPSHKQSLPDLLNGIIAIRQLTGTGRQPGISVKNVLKAVRFRYQFGFMLERGTESRFLSRRPPSRWIHYSFNTRLWRSAKILGIALWNAMRDRELAPAYLREAWRRMWSLLWDHAVVADAPRRWFEKAIGSVQARGALITDLEHFGVLRDLRSQGVAVDDIIARYHIALPESQAPRLPVGVRSEAREPENGLRTERNGSGTVSVRAEPRSAVVPWAELPEVLGMLLRQREILETEQRDARESGQEKVVSFVRIALDEIETARKALEAFRDRGVPIDDKTVALIKTYSVSDAEHETFDLEDVPEFQTILRGGEIMSGQYQGGRLAPNTYRASHMRRALTFFRALTSGNYDYYLRRLPAGESLEEFEKALRFLKSQYDILNPDEKSMIWAEIKLHDIGYAESPAPVGHEARGARLAREILGRMNIFSTGQIDNICSVIERHTNIGSTYLGEKRLKRLLEEFSDLQIRLLLLHNQADGPASGVGEMRMPTRQVATIATWFDPEERRKVDRSFDEFRIRKTARASMIAPDPGPEELKRLERAMGEIFSSEREMLKTQLRERLDVTDWLINVFYRLVNLDPSYRELVKFWKFLGQLGSMTEGSEVWVISDISNPVPGKLRDNGIAERTETVAQAILRMPSDLKAEDIGRTLNGLPEGVTTKFFGISLRRTGQTIIIETEKAALSEGRQVGAGQRSALALGERKDSRFEGFVRSEARTGDAQFVLATTSARRKEYIGKMGFDSGAFKVEGADIDETPFSSESAVDYVKRVALEKAKAVAGKYPQVPVVGMDTILVGPDGAILQKPGSVEANRANLKRISGKELRAVSAVALIRDGKEDVRIETTIVHMQDLAAQPELLEIIAARTYDRAGGIAVQDPEYPPHVRVQGSFSNVVGFPMKLVWDMFEGAGLITESSVEANLRNRIAAQRTGKAPADPAEALRVAAAVTGSRYEQFLLAGYLAGSFEKNELIGLLEESTSGEARARELLDLAERIRVDLHGDPGVLLVLLFQAYGSLPQGISGEAADKQVLAIINPSPASVAEPDVIRQLITEAYSYGPANPLKQEDPRWANNYKYMTGMMQREMDRAISQGAFSGDRRHATEKFKLLLEAFLQFKTADGRLYYSTLTNSHNTLIGLRLSRWALFGDPEYEYEAEKTIARTGNLIVRDSFEGSIFQSQLKELMAAQGTALKSQVLQRVLVTALYATSPKIRFLDPKTQANVPTAIAETLRLQGESLRGKLTLDSTEHFVRRILESEKPVRVTYFIDDNGDLIYHLHMIQAFLKMNPLLDISVVAKSKRIAIDATVGDVLYELEQPGFEALREERGKRFRVVREAPGVVGVDLRNLSPELAALILQSDAVVGLGQVIPECLNGLKKLTYIMCCVDSRSHQRVTGLPQGAPYFVGLTGREKFFADAEGDHILTLRELVSHDYPISAHVSPAHSVSDLSEIGHTHGGTGGPVRSGARTEGKGDDWSSVLLKSSWEKGELASMDDRERMAFLSKTLSVVLKGQQAESHAADLDRMLLRDEKSHNLLPEAKILITSFLGVYRLPLKNGKPVKVGTVFSMYGEQNRLMPKSANNPHGEDAIAAKLTELDELYSINPKVSYELLIMDDGERKLEPGETRDDELLVKSFLEGTLMQSPFWQWYIRFLSHHVRSFLFFLLKMMQKTKLEGNVPGPVIKTQKSSGEVALDILRERFSERLESGQVKVRFVNREQKVRIAGKKGSGIILGMRKLLEDGCDYVIFTDADRAVSMSESGNILVKLAKGEADAAIGSRWREGSVVKGRSGGEKRGSFIYNMTAKLFLGFWWIRDTQCGDKGFTRELLEEILPVDKDWNLDPDFTYNFAFDTHLLLRIRNAKKKIQEVLVVWIGSPDESTLSTESKIEAVLSLAKQVPFISHHITSRSEMRVEGVSEENTKDRAQMRQLIHLVNALRWSLDLFEPVFRVAGSIANERGEVIAIETNGSAQQHVERMVILDAFEHALHQQEDAYRLDSSQATAVRDAIEYLRLSLRIRPTFDPEDIKVYAFLKTALGDPLATSTLAVSVDPCVNCYDYIRAAGLRRVIFGYGKNGYMGDHEKVVHKTGGLQVTGGIFADEALAQNRRTLWFMKHYRTLYESHHLLQHYTAAALTALRHGARFAELRRKVAAHLVQRSEIQKGLPERESPDSSMKRRRVEISPKVRLVLDKAVPAMKQVVLGAGSIIEKRRADLGQLPQQDKEDGTLVTKADFEVQSYILKFLEAQRGLGFPSFKVVAEEKDGPLGKTIIRINEENKDSDWTVVIDPIDGTTQFAKDPDSRHFGTLLSLHYRGEVLAAFLMAPEYQLSEYSANRKPMREEGVGTLFEASRLDNQFIISKVKNGISFDAQVVLEKGNKASAKFSGTAVVFHEPGKGETPFDPRNFNMEGLRAQTGVIPSTGLMLALMAYGGVPHSAKQFKSRRGLLWTDDLAAYISQSDKIWDVSAGMLFAELAGLMVVNFDTGEKVLPLRAETYDSQNSSAPKVIHFAVGAPAVIKQLLRSEMRLNLFGANTTQPAVNEDLRSEMRSALGHGGAERESSAPESVESVVRKWEDMNRRGELWTPVQLAQSRKMYGSTRQERMIVAHGVSLVAFFDRDSLYAAALAPAIAGLKKTQAFLNGKIKLIDRYHHTFYCWTHSRPEPVSADYFERIGQGLTGKLFAAHPLKFKMTAIDVNTNNGKIFLDLGTPGDEYMRLWDLLGDEKGSMFRPDRISVSLAAVIGELTTSEKDELVRWLGTWSTFKGRPEILVDKVSLVHHQDHEQNSIIQRMDFSLPALRSEIRIILPGMRSALDEKFQRVTNFLSAREEYVSGRDVPVKEQWTPVTMDKLKFSKGEKILVMILGSWEDKVAFESAPLIKGLRTRGYDIKVLTSGKYGNKPGVFFDSEGRQLPEAFAYQDILEKAGVSVDFAEPDSTDSGANIRLSKKMIDDAGYKPDTIIVMQNGLIQRRAGLSIVRQFYGIEDAAEAKMKFDASGIRLISYAPYVADIFSQSDEDVLRDMEYALREIKSLQEYPAKGFSIPTEIPRDILDDAVGLTEMLAEINKRTEEKAQIKEHVSDLGQVKDRLHAKWNEARWHHNRIPGKKNIPAPVRQWTKDGFLWKGTYNQVEIPPTAAATIPAIDPNPSAGQEPEKPAWVFGDFPTASQVLFTVDIDGENGRVLVAGDPQLSDESLLMLDRDTHLVLTDEKANLALLKFHRQSQLKGYINAWGIGQFPRLHDHLVEDMPIFHLRPRSLEQPVDGLEAYELENYAASTLVYVCDDDAKLAAVMARTAQELLKLKIPHQVFLEAGKVIFVLRDNDPKMLQKVETENFGGRYLTGQFVGGVVGYPKAITDRITPAKYQEIMRQVSPPVLVRDLIISRLRVAGRSEVRLVKGAAISGNHLNSRSALLKPTQARPRGDLGSVPQRKRFRSVKDIPQSRIEFMVMDFLKRAKPATVLVDAGDFASLSDAQKQEYFMLAFSNKAFHFVVYNYQEQAGDKFLDALLRLENVRSLNGGLLGIESSVPANIPAIHLSKNIVPVADFVEKMRKRVTFFKTKSDRSGSLAMALLWALSGGEQARMIGVREEGGFWTVEESLLERIQKTYDQNLVIAIAA